MVKVRSLEALLAFNEKKSCGEREMPYFGQEILIQAEKKGPLTEKTYQDALASESTDVARRRGSMRSWG